MVTTLFTTFVTTVPESIPEPVRTWPTTPIPVPKLVKVNSNPVLPAEVVAFPGEDGPV